MPRTDRREIAPALPARPAKTPFRPARSATCLRKQRAARWLARLWCLAPLLGLAAAPADVARDPLKTGQNDVVRRKDGTDRREGEILNMDPSPDGYIRLKGQTSRPLSRSEWEVEFWEGVTNADALLKEAQRLLKQIDDKLEALAASNDPPSPKQIEDLAERTKSYLSRISDRASESHRAKGLLYECTEANIRARIAAYQRHRRTVVEVQRAVGELAVKIAGPAKRDLAQECRAIGERLKQDAGVDSWGGGMVGQLRDALHALADELSALKDLGNPPKIDEIDVEALPQAVEQLDQRVQHYQALARLSILGDDLVNAAKASLAEAELALHRARACEAATRDVVSLRGQIRRFQSDVREGRIATSRQFEDRFTHFEESLKRVLDAHRQGTDAGSKYAFPQADRASRELGDWKPRAELLMDVPKLRHDLQRVERAKTAAEARELRKTLEAWQARVRSYRRGTDVGRGGPREEELLKWAAKLPDAISECQTLESDSAYTEAQTALSTMADHLESYASDHSEALSSGAWLTALEHDRGEIGKLRDKVQQGRAKAGSTDQRWNDLAKELDRIEARLKQAIPLASVEDVLAAIPEEITTRNELAEGEKEAARARSRLESLSEDVSAEVRPARDRVHKRLAEAERALALGRARLQFRENDTALTERLDAAEAALAARDCGAAGAALRAASQKYDGLARLVAQTPLLADSDPHTDRLDEQQGRLRELRGRRRRVIEGIRKEAGWIALAKPDSSEDGSQAPSAREKGRAKAASSRPVLRVPATPENRRLHLRMLMSAGRLEEAEELAAGSDAGDELPGDGQARSAIGSLRDRIRFARAVRHEEARQFDRAYALYEGLYSPDSKEPVSVAAGAALNRLDARFQRDRDASRSRQRLVVTIAVAACLAAMGLVLWRRRTRSGRVAAIRQYLGKASRAPRGGGGPGADVYLRQAAQLMAGLPPDDPHVRELEQQLVLHATPRDAAGGAAKDRIPPEKPDVAQELRRILRGGRSTEDAASCCLGWLRETRATASSLRMRHAVGVWLQRHLKPEAHHDDDELAWRARLAAQCEPLAPKKAWPFLYQVRAHYWRGDYEAAMRTARRWEGKALGPAEANEVLMILGQSYVALGRWKDALETFRALRARRGAPPQAREWMHFAWTRRQTERNAPLDRGDLERVIPSLLAAGSSGSARKGPTP